MSDHTPDHHDDLGDLDVDPALVTRLRRALAAVASATPVRDRTDDLLAALHLDAHIDDGDDAATAAAPDARDDELPAIELDPAAPTPRRRTAARWLLSAAAVLAVLLVAGLLTRGGDDAPPVVDVPDAPTTGWFLPPEGWEITSVQTDFLDAPVCPCTRWVTVREGDAPAVIDVLEADAANESLVDGVDGARDIDVAGHAARIATLPAGETGDLTGLVVQVDDRQVTVSGARATEEQVIAIAERWVTQLASGEPVDVESLPPLDGFTTTAPVAQPDWRNVHLLAVTMRHRESGTVYAYNLAPTDWDRTMLFRASSAAVVPGGIRVDVDGSLWDVEGSFAGIVGGQYDLLLGDSFFGDPIDSLTLTEVNDLLDGFRQVSTAEWRAALAAADADGAVDPDVLAAPSLYSTPLADSPPDAGG